MRTHYLTFITTLFFIASADIFSDGNDVELHRLRNRCNDAGYNCENKQERKSILVFRCGNLAYIGMDFWNHDVQIFITANYKRTQNKSDIRFDYSVIRTCKRTKHQKKCGLYNDPTKSFNLRYSAIGSKRPGAPVEVRSTSICPGSFSDFASKNLGDYIGQIFYAK